MSFTRKLKLHIPDNGRSFSTIFNSLDVSENTRKEYVLRIKLFFSYLDDTGLNQQSYLSFKRYLEGRTDYSIATKNKYLITARIFLRELVRKGFLPIDITQGIKGFKQSRRHKRLGLTDKEIQLLGVKLKFLPDTSKHNRQRAIFSLLAFQGLRQIEITRLNVEDIDVKKKTAFIQGKGSDDKEMIYLTPATTKSLERYLKDCRQSQGALFSGMGNRKSDRISTMTIKREMRCLLKDLGIEKTVHGFRHFYVTELLKNMDMRDVRKFSRHHSMEMLIVYDDEVSIRHKSQQVFQVMKKFNY